MAREPESSKRSELGGPRLGLSSVVLVLVGVWLASEAIGAVLGIVRRVLTVLVIAVVVFIGWRVTRARKS
jgi:hypothetical protein